MGRLECRSWSASNALRMVLVILLVGGITACGKGGKAGPPLFPGTIHVIPANTTSLELGGTIGFTAAVQTPTGTNLSTAITWASSDTAILNVAPNGVACAGHWDIAFTTCTPGATGEVTVTASALGATSVPTYVFVHPHIDSITVTGILLTGIPVREPCLSQGESMTVEAHAFSQGTDITSSVGPFTWTEQYSSVVSLVPIVNTAYNFPTNQATATAVTPGMTQIYASASGVTSSSFHQPQYTNSMGTSPALDFFATCPVERIALELGLVGSQQTNQTTFVANKGSGTQTATAVVTDVAGNSSLQNTGNAPVLKNIPLTWTGSQPAVVGVSSNCQLSCSITTPLAGSGSVTASCSPPGCNVGYPFVPASLSTPAAIATCTQFFQSLFPANFNCQQVIPSPVYADVAISGLVTGAPSPAGVLATSTGCAHQPNSACGTAIYSLSTAKASTGGENPMPASPNSLLFDLAGDRAFMGSDFGAQLINPSTFGSSSSAFTPVGTVTGQILAVSSNGTLGIFSDTLHTPNQVYVANTAVTASVAIIPLNISQAVAAGVSPDQLRAFIFGNGGSSLFIYSQLQALQGPITLTGPVNANGIVFSPNSAFAYLAEASANGNPANVTAFNTCNTQVAAPPVLLPSNPLFVRVLPGVHLEGRDSYGFTIPDGVHVLVLDSTGFDILTSTISPPTNGGLCPQRLSFTSNDPSRVAQRVELNQGTLQPVNFFASADGSQLYVPTAGSSSILIYDFTVGSITSGIQLVGNATPLGADMSVDAGTIVIAGSDGLLHEISTGTGGSDQVQLSFPNLPDYLNPFCATYASSNPCSLDMVATRP